MDRAAYPGAGSVRGGIDVPPAPQPNLSERLGGIATTACIFHERLSKVVSCLRDRIGVPPLAGPGSLNGTKPLALPGLEGLADTLSQVNSANGVALDELEALVGRL